MLNFKTLDQMTLDPQSSTPPMAHADCAALLALLYQFEQTQLWQRERLELRQLAQLGQLLEHAYLTVPVMRKRLRSAGYRPGRPLDERLWQRIPVLSRSQVQDLGAALHSQSIPSSHGSVFEVSTSGSTGRPVTVRKTALAQLFWQAVTIRDHVWHRRDLAGALAVIRYMRGHQPMPPDGDSLPDWGPPASLVFHTGPSYALHIVSDIAEQAEWLARCDPNYLLSHPANVEAIALECAHRGIALSRLHEVRTFGEVCDNRTREACRRIWGVKIADIYSAQEIGYLALQCPHGDLYHIQSETVRVEVLDDAGRACAPGEMGRVVATPLHNFATPLIRYEVGDFAVVGGPCSCGRGLPTIQRILGRTRNLMRLPGGRRVWPSTAIVRMPKIAPIRQAQMIQRSLRELEVRLVTERALAAGEEDELRRLIISDLGHAFESIRFVYMPDLPREASGKFEEFISEVVDR